jgi:hypothetical protein
VDKKEYTKVFLEQAQYDCSETSVRAFTKIWWVSPYSPIGLRLTNDGSKFLTHVLKLESYKYQVTSDLPITFKAMLKMSKHLSAPFYLNPQTKTMIFYGEQDATMLALMGGDLLTYLDNFTRE